MISTKTVRIALLVAAAAMVFLIGAVLLIVHSSAFNQFVLAKIIQAAQQATGSRVQIRGIKIHWSRGGADLYGLVIQGRGPDSEPPFFQADHVEVGLKIVSVLRRKIDLRELVVDRPIFDLRVDAQGQINVPKPATSNPSVDPVNSLFALAIGHLAIHSGEICYHDRRVPIAVDLRDFHTDASYGSLAGTYKGSLDYDHGTVLVGEFNAIEHDARMNFIASRLELDLEPLFVNAGGTRFTTRVKLTDYDHPDVQMSYEGSVSTPQLARILKIPALPAGQVAIHGTARYQYAAGRSFLTSSYADGQFLSSRMVVQLVGTSTEAQAVQGSFSVEGGNLHVSKLEADLLQGHLKAQGDLLDLAGRTSTRVSASLQGASLEAINNSLPPGSRERLHFVGRAEFNVQAFWPKRIEDIVAQVHVAIASPQARPTARTIPLNGMLDVRYDGPHDTIAFGQSHLQTGTTQVSLTGTISKQSNLMIQANTTDLRELSALVSEIRAESSNSSAPAASGIDLRGEAHFAGQVSGAAKAPRLQGQLNATNIDVEGNQWRSIRTAVELSSSRIALQNGDLQSVGQGQLNFTASAGLDHWALTPASPITVQTSASNLSVAALEHLAKQHYPVEGTVSGKVSIGGTKQNPSGHGSVEITKAVAWDEPLTNVSASFDAQGQGINSTAQFQLPAGKVSANVTFYPETKQYNAQAETSGLNLGQLHALQARESGIAGLLTASLRGQGSVSDPQVSANLGISEFVVRDQSISSAQAVLDVAHRHANFTLHAVIAQGDVEAKGNMELAGDYNTNATLDVRAVPVGVLVASYVPGAPPNLQGQTEIHASLNGPVKNPALLQAHVEIPIFNLSYESANLSLVGPLRLDYRQGIATLEETELRGTGTDLTLRGVIPVRSNATAFTIAANGGIDLSLVQGFARGIKSSGRIELQMAGRGDLKNPAIQGQLKVENAYFSSDQSPLGIEGVNGQVNISGRRLEIAQLTGKAGGGTVRLQGFMLYGPQANFNVSLESDSVRLRYPEGLRSVLNSNLRLVGTTTASTLSGRVIIDRLSFTDQFDLASFAGQFTSGSSTTSSSPFEQSAKLNVAVQTSQNVNLTSSQVSMQGDANLNITGTLANPVILGRATLSGGDVFFMGKRFEVQNGAIEFSNPIRTEPMVNLYVKTTVQQYDLTLHFNGPVDRLQTSYSSDPPLPASDVISLLTSGQTATAAATNNTPASTSAESVVASGVANQVGGKIQKLAGISQLTIDPLAASNTADPSAQVSIQQRVTGNILLTFSTDVTSTQATTVQLQYRTSRQTSISVLRDQNGGYAIDLRVHKTF